MFKKFKDWLEERKRKTVLKSIRNHMAFFGFDMSEITDEQIYERAITTAKLVRLAGVTTQQASDAIRQLAMLTMNPKKGRPASIMHWCDHCNKSVSLNELEKFFARDPEHDTNPRKRISCWVLLCYECSKKAVIIYQRR